MRVLYKFKDVRGDPPAARGHTCAPAGVHVILTPPPGLYIALLSVALSRERFILNSTFLKSKVPILANTCVCNIG